MRPCGGRLFLRGGLLQDADERNQTSDQHHHEPKCVHVAKNCTLAIDHGRDLSQRLLRSLQAARTTRVKAGGQSRKLTLKEWIGVVSVSREVDSLNLCLPEEKRIEDIDTPTAPPILRVKLLNPET